MSNKIVKRIAADIGGTFTDIAAVTEDGDLLTWKLPSTPPNFADAVSKGIAALSREYSIELSDINEVCMAAQLLPMQSWNRKVPRQP